MLFIHIWSRGQSESPPCARWLKENGHSLPEGAGASKPAANPVVVDAYSDVFWLEKLKKEANQKD